MQKEYDKNNVFYKIINNELPSTKVYEDEKILAFLDIKPSAPVHILVVPKAQFVSYDDFVSKSSDADVSYFFKKIQQIAEEQGLSQCGYRIQANCGEKAGQIVPHFHVHILGYK